MTKTTEEKATDNRAFKLNIGTLSHEQLSDIEDFLNNEHKIFKTHPEIYEAVPYSIKQAVKTHRPRKTSTGGTPRELGQNYISDVMTRFRSFIIWANDNGYTNNNPFKGYSVG